MSAQQSIESLFSNVRRFTWQFNDGFNPSSVSCVAFSVEEAREKLLSYLTQIESLQEEKKRVDQQLFDLWNTDTSYWVMAPELNRINNELLKKLPPIDDKTGCSCTNVIDYGLHMEVTYNKTEDLTLGELISTIDPLVEKFNCVMFTSCLYG
jgi:lantibiotic modifying enzyme